MSQKIRYTEEQLVALLKSQSEVAFNVLYDNYSHTLYGIVLKIVHSEEAAQDVLQESFVKIWRNFSKYDNSKGSLFTWLLNVTRNTAIDFNRSKHVRYQIRMDDNIVGILENQGEHKNYDYIGIKETILKLAPQYRTVLEILYYGGFTQEEASKELNLPLGTLKTRAREAMKIVRELLKDKVSAN